MGAPAAHTSATGAAAGEATSGASAQLERCSAPLGTLAIWEDAGARWYGYLWDHWRLGSTVPVLKLLVQQSNCFVVVDRAAGMDAAMRERSLRDSGEMRAGSRFERGQIAAADYTMSPSITFSDHDAGGLFGSVSGFLPASVSSFGSMLGNVGFREAATMLTLVDNRSGVQVAAAEGAARNVDFGLNLGIFQRSLSATAGGYANTSQGKVVTAAFMDSYNGMVRALRRYRQQHVEGGLGTGGKLGVQGDWGAQEGVPVAVPGASRGPGAQDPDRAGTVMAPASVPRASGRRRR